MISWARELLRISRMQRKGLEKIRRDIDRARAIVEMSRLWIPVDDSTPDEGMCVLIATKDGDVWTGFLDAGRWHYDSSGHPVGQEVTHWMDFPWHPYDNE